MSTRGGETAYSAYMSLQPTRKARFADRALSCVMLVSSTTSKALVDYLSKRCQRNYRLTHNENGTFARLVIAFRSAVFTSESSFCLVIFGIKVSCNALEVVDPQLKCSERIISRTLWVSSS